MTAARLPPQNVEAEQSVLGSLLIDPDALLKVTPFLRPDDFYRETHGLIYRAIVDLHEQRQPADFVTLCEELERRGQLEHVGGPGYVTSLINVVPTSIHAQHYGRIVERTATLRRLISAASEISSMAYERADDEDRILDQAEQLIFGVAQRSIERELVPLRTILSDYYDRIEYLYDHRGQTIGVPTGFIDLDRLLGGFQQADLIIVAGRPGTGKTSLAMTIMDHAARRHGLSIAIFSLEMPAQQVVQRLVAGATGIGSQRLRTGEISEDELASIARAMGELSETSVYIDDTPAIAPMELRAKARRLQAEHPLDLIIVDYLQLMQAGLRMENRVQEVSYISRQLKSLASELHVPVLACSQLSRAVESRPDKRPLLSDLRESGSIEQDADVVMFIYREEMYVEETFKPNIADIIVAKHRNGPTGQLSLRFMKEQTRFANLERMPEEMEV
ncbi:MAG: replicative DNA helicase [Anaerolineae bacterium]